MTHRGAVRGWVTYDWANSAFATTVLSAVFPVFYAEVAGARLSSPAQATQFYTLTLSVSVLVIALISPVLGALADKRGTRKRLLLRFAALGIGATAVMYFISEGQWLFASAVFVAARVGFGASIVFYDALLPHVARPDEVDSVSARAYALGYLGGGLLLAANIVMILTWSDDAWGVRLSFLTVAVWWALFSIPLARSVPEPPGLSSGEAEPVGLGSIVADLRSTFRQLRQLPELGRFLLAFLIYNDAIGVVVSVAAIYGSELGFGSIELLAAILLVQFVGVPFSLLFGTMPGADDVRRRRSLAFIAANIVCIPLAMVGLRMAAPADVTGVAGPGFDDEGTMAVAGDTVSWEGQSIVVGHRSGPAVADVQMMLDGELVVDDDGDPVIVGDGDVDRDGEQTEVEVATAGPHELQFVEIDQSGGEFPIEEIEVLGPARSSNLGVVIGAIVAVQVLAALVALTPLNRIVAPIADHLDTKRAIMVALVAYGVIALWGFRLDSVAEFWGLAWLVAVCQGGSQALSRSLFSRLIPAAESGEFFGFFSVVSKFASFLSPLLFVASVALFGSSRPAVGALIIFFGVGIWLLRGVNVETGVARVAAGPEYSGS